LTTKVLVAGGGIGGLAAALACARVGAAVELFERAEQFSEFGAGVQLGPNITRVLHAWGLEGALREVVALPERLQVRSASSGAELGMLPLGQTMVQRYGAPYVTIHRADLHALLLDAVGQMPHVQLHLSSPVSAVQILAEPLTLTLASGQQASGDVLVAADGGFSAIRQQLLQDGLPQPTGHLAYRALVLQSDLPQALRSQQVTVWLGPKMHVVHYPVRSGNWLNVVAIIHGQVQGDMAHWDHSANAADLQLALAQTSAPLQDLIHAIPAWRLWPLSIRPPMSGAHQHAHERVAFLGDAAHPMVPYLAQGAAMAMEDAACLAQVLASAESWPTPSPRSQMAALLQRYAQHRWPRNAKVQARAIRNGEIFHAQGLVKVGRDIAMHMLGEGLLDQPWLYGGGPM
jgi:salicylate hydroxylase